MRRTRRKAGGDGVPDGSEVLNGSNPLEPYSTLAVELDLDIDGLSNDEEIILV